MNTIYPRKKLNKDFFSPC